MASVSSVILPRACNASKASQIKNHKRTIADFNQPAAAEFRKNFTDVDRRETGGISYMMLAQREFDLDRIAMHHISFGQPFKQTQKQSRYSFIRSAAAQIDDQLIAACLLLDPRSRNLLEKIIVLKDQFFQFGTIESPVSDVRDSFDLARKLCVE